MRILSKGKKFVCYMIQSILAKLRWRSSLIVTGLFRKRMDTQIIINKKGKMYIGDGVSFQRNVALAAVWGG